MKEIIEALAKLDTENDTHWNKDGSPKLAIVNMLTPGVGATAENVAEAAPGFSRADPTLPSLAAEVTTTAPFAANTPAVPPVAPTAPAVPTEPEQNETPELSAVEILRNNKHRLEGIIAAAKEELTQINAELDALAVSKQQDPQQDLYAAIQAMQASEASLPARINVEGFVARNKIDNPRRK